MKKEISRNFFATALSLFDKVLSSPRIKLLTTNFLFLYRRDAGFSLTDFAQTLKLKNAEVPDIYFTWLDAADMTPSLVLNKHAKEIDSGSWVPFKIWETKTAEVVQRWSWSWWFSQKLDKGKQTPSFKSAIFSSLKAQLRKI